ncbi:MAG: hypothetical protein WAO78_10680 [Roseovarius sp.]
MIRVAEVRGLSGTYPYVLDMFNGGLSVRDVIEGFDINSVGSGPLDLVMVEFSEVTCYQIGDKIFTTYEEAEIFKSKLALHEFIDKIWYRDIEASEVVDKIYDNIDYIKEILSVDTK